MTPLDIRNAIFKAGLNQAAIARAIGVHPTFVSRIIDGHCVSRRVHEAIAEAIGMDIRQIWPERYLERPQKTRRGRPARHWQRTAA